MTAALARSTATEATTCGVGVGDALWTFDVIGDVLINHVSAPPRESDVRITKKSQRKQAPTRDTHETSCGYQFVKIKNAAMFEAVAPKLDDKPTLYRELVEQTRGLLTGERDLIANAANLSSLLMLVLPDLNWAGFYFMRSDDELVLGPFQGKPACVRIKVGKGVCGTAVAERRSQLVADVHAFPGHIACDAGSASELVTPIIVGERVVGVLDLDSPHKARFDEDDRAGLEAVVQAFIAATDFT